MGPGNAPCYVAADADIETAASGIVSSKAYDNGLICGAEHNLVVDEAVHDAFVTALDRHGAAVLNAEETRQFIAAAIVSNGHGFVGRVIGQSAQAIAAPRRLSRSYPIKVIVVPVAVDAVEQGSPLAKEKLAPILSLFTVRGEDDGFALCRRILAAHGAGHTAVIHTRLPERVARFDWRCRRAESS